MHTRTHRRAAAAAALAAVAALTAGCVSTSDATPGSPSSSGAALAFGSAGNPGDADTTVDVKTSDEMRYAPGELRVERGETVLFVVTNTGRLPHEFTIGDEAGQERHAEEMADMGAMPHDHPFSVWLEPGETKELAWEFGVAGDFLYGCHVPGHYEAGMVGRITVT